ncbi:MAG: leucyl aminopeptidase [Parvularculaceae bacterium]
MQITFSKAALPKTGAVIIPCFENGASSKGYRALDKATDGALTRASKSGGFTGKKDQTLEIVAPAGVDYSRIVLTGVGKAKEFDARAAESAGGAGVAKVLATREKTVIFELDGVSAPRLSADAFAAHIASGARLRAYRFDKYRTKLEKDQKPALTKISVHTEAAGARSVYADLDKVVDGVFLTRDLVSEPANVLYPESFARKCRELEDLGVRVKVLSQAELKKLGMGLLLGVGQGSARDSRVVAMEWMGGGKGVAPICFVGKGVTFDTGGISLKPGPGMWDMKWDMAGAGAVAGALAALAGRKAKANVVGVIGLVENMPDAAAQRPGDIVKSMSGQTVEVLNTDAEGRLVLGDVMWWAQETYKPKTVIDLATLTGAIIVALANEFAGLFSNDDKLAAQLEKAGEATGDRVWRMPLGKAFDDMIKSDVADMKNIGPKEGPSCSAAAFLQRFVKPGVAWAHIDMAGKASVDKDHPTTPKGATGYGVRLLEEFVRANDEKA